MCGVEFLKFDLQSMKTMKYILLIICVACASTMLAVDYKLHQTSSATFKSTSTSGYSGAGIGEGKTRFVSTYVQKGGCATAVASTPSFRSTSAMPTIGSSLSSAVTMVVDEPETTVTPGPKRNRPGDNKDPYLDPIGDAVLPLLLLAAGYAIYLRRKNSVRTSDSGHQQ